MSNRNREQLPAETPLYYLFKNLQKAVENEDTDKIAREISNLHKYIKYNNISRSDVFNIYIKFDFDKPIPDEVLDEIDSEAKWLFDLISQNVAHSDTSSENDETENNSRKENEGMMEFAEWSHNILALSGYLVKLTQDKTKLKLSALDDGISKVEAGLHYLNTLKIYNQSRWDERDVDTAEKLLMVAEKNLNELKTWLKEKREKSATRRRKAASKTEKRGGQPKSEEDKLLSFKDSVEKYGEVVQKLVDQFKPKVSDIENRLKPLFAKREKLEKLTSSEEQVLQDLIREADDLARNFLTQLEDSDFDAVLESLRNILGNLPSGLIDPEDIKLKKSIERDVSLLLAEVESLKDRFDNLGVKLWFSHRDTVENDLPGVDVSNLEHKLRHILEELDNWQSQGLTPERIIQLKGPKQVVDELEQLVKLNKKLKSAIEQFENDASKPLIIKEKVSILQRVYLEGLEKAISKYKELVRVVFDEKKFFTKVFPELDDSKVGTLVHDINDLKNNVNSVSVKTLKTQIEAISAKLDLVTTDVTQKIGNTDLSLSTPALVILTTLDQIKSDFKAVEKVYRERLDLDEFIKQTRAEIFSSYSKPLNISMSTPNVVKNFFEPIENSIKARLSNTISREERLSLEDLLKDAYLAHFRKLGENWERLMSRIEGDVATDDSRFEPIESYITRRTEEDKEPNTPLDYVAKKLKEIYQPRWAGEYGGGNPEFFLNLLEQAHEIMGMRKRLNYQWAFNKSSFADTSNRSIPEEVSLAKQPITGADVHTLINGGLNGEITRWLGITTNMVMGKIKVIRRMTDHDLDHAGNPLPGLNIVRVNNESFVEDEVEVTATGFVSRLLDALFRGDLKIKLPKEVISVSNLHFHHDEIIDYAHKVANRVLGVDVSDDGWEKNAKLSRKLVELAFRNSFVTFLHASTQTRSISVGTSDPLFYLTHLGAYIRRYEGESQGGFEPLFTTMFVGDGSENPILEFWSSETKFNAARKKVDEYTTKVRTELLTDPLYRDHYERRKYASFKFMVRYPYIIDHPRSTALENGSFRSSERFVNDFLSFLHLGQEVLDGGRKRVGVFSDLRSVGAAMRSTTNYYEGITVNSNGIFVDGSGAEARLFGDEFIYEIMPFKDHGTTTINYQYLFAISSGAMPVFQNILKVDAQKAISFLSSSENIKNLRTWVGYMLPVLNDVGAEIQAGTLDKKKQTAIKNQIVLMFVHALALLKTSDRMDKKERWGQKDLNDRLSVFVRNDAITYVEKEAVEIATLTGRSIPMFIKGIGDRVVENVGAGIKYN